MMAMSATSDPTPNRARHGASITFSSARFSGSTAKRMTGWAKMMAKAKREICR